MATRNPALRRALREVGERQPAWSAPNRAPGSEPAGWATPRSDGAATAPGFPPPPGATSSWPPAAPPGLPQAPDTVSPWPPVGPPGALTAEPTMRVGGVVTASGVLLVILAAAGLFGWSSVKITTAVDTLGRTVVTDQQVPGWLIPSVLAGFALALVTIFVPKAARFTAPLYAAAEGLFLGAISHLFDVAYDGIVVQAVGLTVAVFAVMLVLYATRVIRPTRRFVIGVFAATAAVAVVYLLSMVARLFGANVPLLNDTGPLGIGLSLVIVTIAALNLIVDFLTIETLVQERAPRYYEWYGAFSLLVTIVWLYLEILRLLAKLRSR
ncbi:MAG: Bax inhibitor-1/YccA family protein [Actinobacteria bacterium]|nr:Bax inhibitor-1/YccA family protein [Actinomycetota bacterium]